MKRYVSTLLALTLTAVLASCGGTHPGTTTPGTPGPTGPNLPAATLRVSPDLGPVTLRVDGQPTTAGQVLSPVPAGEYRTAYAFDGDTFKGAALLLPGETGGTVDATSTTVFALARLAFMFRSQSDYQPKVIAALRAHPRLAEAAAGFKATGTLNEAAGQVLQDVTAQVNASRAGLGAQDVTIIRGPLPSEYKVSYANDASAANAIEVRTFMPYKAEVRLTNGNWTEPLPASKPSYIANATSYTGVGLLDFVYGIAEMRRVSVPLPDCGTVTAQTSFTTIYNRDGQFDLESPGVINTINQISGLTGLALNVNGRFSSLSAAQQRKLATLFTSMFATGGQMYTTAQDIDDLNANVRNRTFPPDQALKGVTVLRQLLVMMHEVIMTFSTDEVTNQKVRDLLDSQSWLATLTSSSGAAATKAVEGVLIAYDLAAALDYFTTILVEQSNGGYYSDALARDDRTVCRKPVISELNLASMTAPTGQTATGTLTFSNIGEPGSQLDYVIRAPGLTVEPDSGTVTGDHLGTATLSYPCTTAGQFRIPVTVHALYPAAANPDPTWQKEKTVDAVITCTAPAGLAHLQIPPVTGRVWGTTNTVSVIIQNTSTVAFNGHFTVSADPDRIIASFQEGTQYPLVNLYDSAFGMQIRCPAQGTYSAALTFTGNADNTPMTVPVNVTCG